MYICLLTYVYNIYPTACTGRFSGPYLDSYVAFKSSSRGQTVLELGCGNGLCTWADCFDCTLSW